MLKCLTLYKWTTTTGLESSQFLSEAVDTCVPDDVSKRKRYRLEERTTIDWKSNRRI